VTVLCSSVSHCELNVFMNGQRLKHDPHAVYFDIIIGHGGERVVS